MILRKSTPEFVGLSPFIVKKLLISEVETEDPEDFPLPCLCHKSSRDNAE